MTDIQRRLNNMRGGTASITDRLNTMRNSGESGELVLPTAASDRDVQRAQLERDLAEVNQEQRLLAARTNLARRSRGFTNEDRKAAQEEAAPLRREADDLRHGVEGIDYQDKYDAISRQNNFGGQFLASWDAGTLGQDEAMAWHNYLANPTEGNRAYAEAVSAARESYLVRNQEALDEDATLPLISQSMAGYLPQFIGQNLAGAKGALVGAAAGSVLPGAGTAAGAKAGYAAGRALYGYETAQGAAFKALLDAGVDEETARAAASDEAVINSIIEGGDAVIDMLTLGIGKGIGALLGQPAKTAATSFGRKALSALGKYGINVASEGAQEWVQEGVASANANRGDTGILNLVGESAGQIGRALTGQDPEALARMNQAGIEGMKVAAIMGGATMGTNALIGRVAGRNNTQTELPTAENPTVTLPGSDQGQETVRNNNTVSTGETANENGLTALTERERANLSSGERNKIVSTFQDAVSFVRNALSNRQSTDRAYLGKVPDATAKKVLSDTGVNITGYNAVMPSGAVRHMFNRHGDTGTEASLGQRAITPEDVARIPSVISGPDRVTVSTKPDASGRTALLFEKDLGDIFVTVQAVSDGTHSIQADTLYIRKKNSQDTVSDNGAEAPSPNRNVQNVPPQSSPVNSIPSGAQNVNTQGVRPEGSVGAAPAGFDVYGRLIEKYGAIEPGENPAPHSYVVEVPKQTTPNDRVSLSARTIMEAAVTPDAMIPDLAQMVVDGKFSRIPVSNQKSVSQAESRIRQVGYQNALMSWIQDVKNGNVSERTLAMGAVLYNNAATKGAGKTALDIAYYFAQAATQSARATQASRILKQLTPDGQLYMIQKMVNDVNEAVSSTNMQNDPSNVPVDLWMQRVGENLADELSTRLKVPKSQAKTVSEVILSDLRRYANKTAPKAKKISNTRSEMDRITDLFENRAAYEEAWQAAKYTLMDNFENDPDALSAFDAWLDSSLEYTKRLTKELTGQNGISISEELANKFLSAKTDEDRSAVLDEINQYIADQIPSTFLEKFNALRYLNMLGNLKTQVRNVGGNAIMKGVRAGRVKVQAALESVAEKNAKRKGKKFERTTSATRDSEIYKLAKEEFDSEQAQIMGEQKYSYNGRTLPADIQNRRRIFKINGTWGTSENSPARLLRRFADAGMAFPEGARRLTNWAMDKGDVVFARSAYADALSRYLKANGVTVEQYRIGTVDEGLLERARAHAVREAQEATFRDKNAFSNAISSIGFKRPQNNVERGINMAVQGVLPFRRTPANVAVRAVEYSPLGIIDTIHKELTRRKQNKILEKGGVIKEGTEVTGTDVLNSLSKTLTGSGIMALGIALGYFGALTGMEGDDEDQNELNAQSGRQDYALYLPNGFNFTLDWASPASIPLFMGAELGAELERNGIQAKDVFDAVASSSNVLLDMSMLQGVNDQLSNISYSENPLVDLALNSLTDYLTAGFTSTLGGQIERTLEDKRMTTYTDENSRIPTDVQYTIGSQSARLPGWDYQQIPYVDAWGREESNGSPLSRAFNQFLNPAYTASDTSTPAIEETQRLYDLTGDGSVVNKRPGKEITVDSEDIYLNSGQYLQYATERGQERDRLVSSVIQSLAYQALPTEDQVAVIKDIYSYTDAVAKSHISDYEPEGWIAKVVESGADPAEYILYKHSLTDGMTLKERSAALERSGITGRERTDLLLAENPEWAEKAREYGVSDRVYVEFKVATSDVSADKDENGKSIRGSEKKKVMDIIDGMDVSDEIKDRLYYAAGCTESTIDDAPWR